MDTADVQPTLEAQLARAQREHATITPRAAVMVPSVAACDDVRRDGAARVKTGCSAAEIEALRAFVLRTVASGSRPVVDWCVSAAPGGPETRLDLPLPLGAPAVRAALRGMLAEGTASGDALAALAGDDAELFELAVLVSAPGAPPQSIHADTPFSPRPTSHTCFMALQDVSRPMGPTMVLLGTHRERAHDGLRDCGPDDAKWTALAGGWRPMVATLCAGEALVMDSRALHCGGANESAETRALFYVSFVSKGERAAVGDRVGTIHNHLDSAGHTLESLRRRVSRPRPPPAAPSPGSGPSAEFLRLAATLA